MTATLTTPVDLSKSFVYCSYNSPLSTPGLMPTCQLTANDTVTITSYVANASFEVSYFVVEFASDIVVQRGAVTMLNTETTKTVPISAVNLSNSFVLVTSRINLTNTSDPDEQRWVSAVFQDASTLKLARTETSAAGKNVEIEWQVISLSYAQVQSGTATISGGNLSSGPIALANPIHTDSSFILMNFTSNPAVDGVEARYYTRATILNSEQIEFIRGVTTSGVTLEYFVIDLGYGSKFQHGLMETVTNTEVTFSTTISLVNRDLAVPFISFAIGGDGDNGGQDSGSFIATYPNATTLQVERYSHENRYAGINYFAVEFASWSAADLTVQNGSFALGGKSPAGELFSYDYIKVRKFVNPEPWVTVGGEIAN